jgi:Glycosyltransferase family 87
MGRMLPSAPVRSEVYGLRLLAQPSGRRAVLVLIVAILAVFRILQLGVLSTDRMWAADFSYYWTAGSQLLHGGSIYSAEQLAGPYVPENQTGFLYPPAFAALMLPFAALFPSDPRAAGWLWAAIGAAILVASVWAVVWIEGLDRRFEWLPRPRPLWFVAAALFLPTVVAELSVGNVHLEIVGLLSLAWLCVRESQRHRGPEGGAESGALGASADSSSRGASADSSSRGEWLGGAAVGAAALLKVFPGVLLLWFLATRRWRGAAGVIVGAGVLAALSLPFTGLQPWLDYPRVLANMGLVLDVHDSVSPTMWLTPVLGFDVARWLVTLAGVALLVWAARARSTVVSFAIAAVVAVVIAPSVFHHYLSVLVLPLLLALAGGVPAWLVALSYFLMWGGQQPALGEWSWVLSRVPQTLGWLFLLAGLALQVPARPATPSESYNRRLHKPATEAGA